MPLINKNCHSFILDGEMMGWHKAKKIFGSKSYNYDVKKLTENSAFQPCFIAYDIIFYNDELLTDKPYSERFKILQGLFTEKEGIIVRCKTTLISTK